MLFSNKIQYLQATEAAHFTGNVDQVKEQQCIIKRTRKIMTNYIASSENTGDHLLDNPGFLKPGSFKKILHTDEIYLYGYPHL